MLSRAACWAAGEGAVGAFVEVQEYRAFGRGRTDGGRGLGLATQRQAAATQKLAPASAGSVYGSQAGSWAGFRWGRRTLA